MLKFIDGCYNSGRFCCNSFKASPLWNGEHGSIDMSVITFKENETLIDAIHWSNISFKRLRMKFLAAEMKFVNYFGKILILFFGTSCEVHLHFRLHFHFLS
jgi:hypothetical protein